MIADLDRLLHGVATPDPAAMRSAVVNDNLLGKATQRTRVASWQRLARLYGLSGKRDPALEGFLTLWQAEPVARPQLALARALTQDGLLRLSAPFILAQPTGQTVTAEQMAGALRAAGVPYNEKTLRSTSRNLLSSWTQAGVLEGKARKRRREVVWSPALVALLLRHAYLAGRRGAGLYHTPELVALGLTPDVADGLAAQAGQRGLLSYKRIGEVVEITFPDLDRRAVGA